MKLISCHIEGFGKIVSEDISFSQGMNVIYRDNGEGKTTIAAFISAMFYGLDSSRKNDASMKNREKYLPWSGSRFGGNLIFEDNSGIYKIERSFDKKSEKNDTVTVYDLKTGETTEKFGASVGQSVFGIGRASFEKSIFMSGKYSGENYSELCPESESSPDDLSEYDNAMERLIKAHKLYKADRGDKGRLKDNRSSRFSAKQRLESSYSASEMLKDECIRLEELKEERKKLDEKRSLFTKYGKLVADRENYALLLKDKKTAEDALCEFDRENESIMLSVDGIKRAKEINQEIIKLEAKLQSMAETVEDKERTAYLEELFKNGVPDDGEITNIGEMIKKSLSVKAEIESLTDKHDDPDEEKLINRFDGKIEIDEDFEKAVNYDYQLDVLNRKREKLKSSIDKKEYEYKAHRRPLSIFLYIMSGLCLIASAVLLLTYSDYAMYPMLMVAAFFFFALFVDSLASKKERAKIDAERNRTLASYDEKIEEYEKGIRHIFTKYGYTDRNDYSLMKNDYRSYQSLCEKRKKKGGRINELRDVKQGYDSAINAYFVHFKIRGGDHETVFYQFKNDVNDYKKLRENRLLRTQETDKIGAVLDEYESKLEGVFKRMSEKYPDDGVNELISRAEKLISDRKLIEDRAVSCAEKCSAFEKTHDTKTEMPEGITEKDIDSVAEKITELDALIARTEEKCTQLMEEADRYTELESEIARLDGEYEVLCDEYDTLIRTEKLLESARSAVLSRYTQPIKDAYCSFAEKIDPELVERVRMDSHFNLIFEREGADRSEEFFSSGFRSMADICMRLALLDIIFGEEKPFVLLDDPFVFLDDDNTVSSLKSLESVSDKVQIIYFTCSSSRLPN